MYICVFDDYRDFGIEPFLMPDINDIKEEGRQLIREPIHSVDKSDKSHIVINYGRSGDLFTLRCYWREL